MKITLDDVIAFYESKGINSACPVCGKADWTLLEPPNEFTWALGSARSDGGMVIPSPNIPVITLMCGHCYAIRTHAALPIQPIAEDRKG